jgi:ribosomal protein L13
MERRTWSPKLGDLNSVKRWYLVDAEGQTLGRIASVIAAALRGKNNPTYTPHADMGDFVVVVNAEKVVLTGKKETQKLYSRHSGYPGGLRRRSVRDVRASHPECEACCRGTSSAGGSSGSSRSTRVRIIRTRRNSLRLCQSNELRPADQSKSRRLTT